MTKSGAESPKSTPLTDAEIEFVWDEAVAEVRAGLHADCNITEVPGVSDALEGLRRIFGGPEHPPNVAEIRSLLADAMPWDSMICDLYDWDIQVESGDYLSDDWVQEAAFGSEESVGPCAEELADFFLQKCDEYGIDYGQSQDPVEFEQLVGRSAEAFIRQWRSNLRGNAAAR